MFSFGYFPGVWIIYADVSEHSICSIFIGKPMKMEQIECSETSAYIIQTPAKYPKENIIYSKHGESLKSRICVILLTTGRFFFSEKTNIVSFDLHSFFVVGSGNSYSNSLLHFSYYIICIIPPLVSYSLPYPKSANKFSYLMDIKPTANKVSGTITTEGMSARHIWGQVSVCLGNWMEKILSARISRLHPYSTSSRQFQTSKSQ